jgi:ATP-dependent Lon protease
MFDKFRDECGVFAIHGHPEASNLAYLGLYALQHRGQESAGIAYTYVREIAGEFAVDPDYFENQLIHLHIPAGATPKDGPSAGITMASSLLSLATGKRIKKRLAMTGELSLVGNVLPIGGLKEKVIAARRNKIKEIIYQKANEKDLEEVPEHIRKGITFHAVQRMDEVIEHLF